MSSKVRQPPALTQSWKLIFENSKIVTFRGSYLMSRFLMVLGVSLLGVGIFLFFTNAAPTGVIAKFPASVLSANDRLAIDPDRLKGAIQEAKKRADQLNQAGVTLQSIAQWLLFLVFVIGSAIAFLAGLQKLMKDLKKEKVWLTIVLGLLGSLSAVSSYGAGYFDQQAKAKFACVSSIESSVRKSIGDIRAESNSLIALQYLDEMLRKVRRCNQ